MVVANVLLATVFLGVPRAREKLRANEARADFARFAACFYGGEASRHPGLGLPEGDLAHFAYQAVRAGRAWPGRCRAPLLAIAPTQVTFLLPSAAAAEGEVRRAVDLVRRELDGFAVGRATAPQIATRPLRAVGLLRAALAQMVEASGADGGLRDDALRFSRLGALVEPTRVPLYAAVGGSLYVEARGDGLLAFGLDGRGLGIVRLGAGQVDARRVARPRGVVGVLPGPADVGAAPRPIIPWFVSLTPESRCAEDPVRCAHRTMGIAPIAPGVTAAPSPLRLAAHPWGGAFDDTARVLPPSAPGGPSRLAVLARTVNAGPELRVFLLDGAEETGLPVLEQPLDVGGQEVRAARLLPDGRAVVLVTAADGLRAMVFDAEARTSRVVGEVSGTSGALLRTCVTDDTVWVALASMSEARLVRVLDAGQPVALAEPMTLSGGAQLDAARAVLVCDARGALLVAPLRAGGAALLACDGPGECRVGALHELPRTAAVAAARDDGQGIVAYSVRYGRVQVMRVDRRGVLGGASEVPAACWDDGTGLCGAPALAARNGRIVLVTREGTDLRALETADGGATWRPLRALRAR